MKRKQYHKHIKLFYIVILLFIVVFFTIQALMRIVLGTNSDISLNSKSDIKYVVKLKENSYYDKKELGPNMKYIASLIDYIDSNINYTIESTDIMNYEYTYSIDAITKVYGDTSKLTTLYEKKENIVKEKTINIKNNKNLLIDENIIIDYNKYNNLIASFKTSYDLTSSADVTIVLNVQAKAKDKKSKKSVNISDSPKLVIPLTEQTVGVEITQDPVNNYKVIKESRNFIQKNLKDLLITIIGFIISFILLIKIMSRLGVLGFGNVSDYKKELNKILKEYDLIIANVDHHIDEDKYEVVKVESFSELKDVHDNIGSPILYKEIKKNMLSEFLIVKDDFLYKYVLRSTSE